MVAHVVCVLSSVVGDVAAVAGVAAEVAGVAGVATPGVGRM